MGFLNVAEILKILVSIITLLNFVGIIFVFIANRLSFTKIINNDLQHLSQDVKSIVIKQETLQKDVSNLSDAVAYMRGFFDAKMVSVYAKRKTGTVKKCKKEKV